MLKTTAVEDKKTEGFMELNCSDEDIFVVEVGSQITHQCLEGRKSLKRKSFGTRAGCIKQVVASYKEPPLKSLSPEIFKDESLTIGGQVKARGQVLKTREEARSRPPNTTCRVETFGRICQTFDERRTRWVVEMGFGGLLHFAGDMHLPRQLSYWLMSCIDPLNYTLRCADGRVFALSKNQVHWVLGIPNRGMCVPCYNSLTFARKGKVHEIMGRYGKAWSSKSNKTGRQYKSEGIPVDKKLMERVEGYWGEEDGDEFKMLFLLLSLEMLLCPTQSSRLASDLVPCLTCASEASEYDWCSLVLKKLMDSVATFARRFYASGYATGCGGCLIFAVVFYLDRLERQPVSWGLFPRIQAWTMNEIRSAVKEDRLPDGGDFGVFGSLDVAYGESHPLLARDTQGPDVEDPLAVGRPRKRKMPTPRRVAMRKNLRQYRLRDERMECVFCHCLSSCHASNTREMNSCFNGRELVIDVSFHDRIKRSISHDAAKAFEMVQVIHIIAWKLYLNELQVSKYSVQRPVNIIFGSGVGINTDCMHSLRRLIENGCCGAMVLVSQVSRVVNDSSCLPHLSSVAVFLKRRCSLELYTTQLHSPFVFQKQTVLNFAQLCLLLRLKSTCKYPRDMMMVLTLSCHH